MRAHILCGFGFKGGGIVPTRECGRGVCSGRRCKKTRMSFQGGTHARSGGSDRVGCCCMIQRRNLNLSKRRGKKEVGSKRGGDARQELFWGKLFSHESVKK